MMMSDILIIEDEVHIAELERDYLELNGFTCDLAMSIEEGTSKIQSGEYRLIIMDLMLPDGSGLDLSKKIDAKYDIPILMVTAKGEDVEMLKGFSHGAADYIVKPFNPNELVARVRTHISRYERLKNQDKDEQILLFNNVIINMDSRSVTVNDENVEMTVKEFDLLHFLAINPNSVFTKEELFEKIWG